MGIFVTTQAYTVMPRGGSIVSPKKGRGHSPGKQEISQLALRPSAFLYATKTEHGEIPVLGVSPHLFPVQAFYLKILKKNKDLKGIN